MRKAILVMLACILAFAVSCEQDKAVNAESGVVDVSMQVSDPKAISVIVDDEVTFYEYRALPQFNLDGETYNEGIFGEQQTWRSIEVDEGRRASLGYYRQGLWIFQVRSLNKSGQVLATGESDPIYLQKGHQNVVRITLKTDDGEGRDGENENTGKIRFGFETNLLDLTSVDLNNVFITLEVNKFDTEGKIDTTKGNQGAIDWNSLLKNASTGAWKKMLPETPDGGWMATEFKYDDVIAEGRTRYYAETPDLVETEKTNKENKKYTVYTGGIDAGQYLVRVLLKVKDETTAGAGGEKVIAGQQIALKVVGGETTTVVGTFVPEKYISTALALNVAPEVAGSVKLSTEGTDQIFEIVTDKLSEATIQLKYVPQNDVDNISYQWYVNGDLVANATNSVFTFQPAKYGDNKITCHVMGYLDGKFGKQASATQVVRVMPKTGANVGGDL